MAQKKHEAVKRQTVPVVPGNCEPRPHWAASSPVLTVPIIRILFVIQMVALIILTSLLIGRQALRLRADRSAGGESLRVQAPAADAIYVHLDQARRWTLTLPAGEDSTLLVSTQPGEMLPSITAASAGFSDSLRSILTTAIGSIVAASLGFIVQKFLQSGKTT
jgi:hypothetical protein